MSSSTICKLLTNPTADEIVAFLKTKEDITEAKVLDYHPSVKKSYTNGENELVEYISNPTGYISLTVSLENGEKDSKTVFFIEQTQDGSEETSVSPFIPEKFTYLSFDVSDSSVKVCELIAGNFGGFVIDDDCADEDSQEFYRLFEGNGEYVMSEAEKALLAKLAEVGSKDKYNLMKIIKENKDILFDYLKEEVDA